MPALALRLGSLLIGCASVACAAALLANAASTADAQTMVGVSAGPAFVDLQGREREEPLKYEVGAQVRAPINPAFGIRSGILLRTLGLFIASAIEDDELYRSTYLSLPLELEAQLPSDPHIRSTFAVGLSLDVLLDAHSAYGPGSYVARDFRKLGWSMSASTGLRFPTIATDVRLRGSLGVTEALKSPWRLDLTHRSIALEFSRWFSI